MIYKDGIAYHLYDTLQNVHSENLIFLSNHMLATGIALAGLITSSQTI